MTHTIAPIAIPTCVARSRRSRRPPLCDPSIAEFCTGRFRLVGEAIPTRDDVERAAATIRGLVRRTPLLDGSALGDGVLIKAELFQYAGSFKARGVTNRLAALTQDERGRGVIGVSAGNHAMALAWGAAREGLDCLLVMFRGASSFKLARTRDFGATVEVVDGDPLAAFERMGEIVAETGRVVVHPFDDPLVVAGQGTVGLEIVEADDGLDTVVVPTGGGGLVAGIAAAVAPVGVEVVAVEPEHSAALREALPRAGRCRSPRSPEPAAWIPRTPAISPSSSARRIAYVR